MPGAQGGDADAAASGGRPGYGSGYFGIDWVCRILAEGVGGRGRGEFCYLVSHLLSSTAISHF